MSTRNRRRAERIQVGFPAQVYTHRGFIEAKLRDLSRTGLRMRVRVADLDMRATEDRELANRRVLESLAPHFAIDLDHKKFGPLLQREVDLVRVELVPDAPFFVDLCCVFDRPLDEEVLAILRQDLPPVRPDDWEPEDVPELVEQAVALEAAGAAPAVSVPAPAAAPGPTADPGPLPDSGPRHRYRALVSGTTAGAPPAFFCHTDLVTVVGVRVQIPRPHEATDIRTAMAKLVKAHGATVDVRIIDGGADLWQGRARVTSLELPATRPDDMLVTLTYERPLSMATMRRLGLLAA